MEREDAAFLTREFQPTFSATDLINLPNHDMYLKLMIDGAPSRPFNTNIHPYQPQEGTLLLFPSWLPHMVEANQSEERRISIAFNVMLKGKMGAHTMRAEV